MQSANSNIFDLNQLIGNLQQAAKGVVFIEMLHAGSVNQFSTGLLITPNVVLIPYFSREHISKDTKYTCLFTEQETSTRIELKFESYLSAKENTPESDGFALFSLQENYSDRTARINVNTITTDSSIFVLQYINGAKSIKVSAGEVEYTSEFIIQYNAGTLPGASGGPVIDENGNVIAIHKQKSSIDLRNPDAPTSDLRYNTGVPVKALLELMKKTPQWNEIAMHHNFVSIEQTAASSGETKEITKEAAIGLDHPLLIRAALQWHIDPAVLQKEEKDLLKKYVIDIPGKWVIKPEERQRIIAKAGSFDTLRKAYSTIKKDDIGTQVIDRILEGPPYDLSTIEEKELPYWLQAVTWFDNTTFKLPDPSAIAVALEQRRMKSRLRQVVGPDFIGRTKELDTMKEWYKEEKQGPLMITGIGGVGKSALVSKFVLEQPAAIIFFWLDFDRADLSPDDAESILAIIAQQASNQVPGFERKEWKGDDWKQHARDLGHALGKLLRKNAHPAMLILDGFEVAQHVKKYNEIWSVLECLMEGLPELKVIVSGRAAVPLVLLLGRKTKEIPLKGMDEENATRWLKSHKVTDEKTIKEVLRISKGVPLILRLAAKLNESKETLSDLPKELPQSLVEGYLYQRILNRIIDPLLRELAKDVLVVRRVSIPLLEKIFSDKLPKDMSVQEVFERLMREMSLVNELDPGGSMIIDTESHNLTLRPEVRTATLKLLEFDNPDRIKLIHQNTVKWYAASDLTNISNRAELIYHYLKLGDIAAAEKLWTPDCIQPLIEAHIDFAEGNEARKWLEQRTVVGDVISEIAEQETIRRIKDALVRGNDRVVTGILQEKTRHAPDGMLLNYDALMMIKGKEFAKAYDLLSGTPSSKGLVTYQRKILLALAAMRIGEMNKCEELLLPLEEIATRSKFPAEYLLIRSARIRLNIDVAKEMKLFSTMMLSGRRDEDIVTRFLVPADVILPGLVNMLEENGVVMESFTSSLEIPYGGSGLHEFISLLNRKRRQSTQFDIEGFPPDTSLAEAERRWYVLLKDRMVKYGEPKELKDFEKTIIDLAVGGLKKWMLATQDFYLARITDTLNEQYLDINTNAADKILLAFIGALAALRGEQLDFGNKDESNDYYKQASSYGYNDGGTDHFIRNKISNTRIMRTPLMPRIESVRQALEIAEIHNEKQLTSVLQSMLKHIEETGKNPERFGILIEDLMPYPPQIFALLIFLLGPDPLEELCRFVMELPVDFEF